MLYYYVTFQGIFGRHGHTVIQQHEGPDGFNVAGIHTYLMDLVGEPCIVHNWYLLTEKRYEEFKRYLIGLEKKGVPGATLVGGKKPAGKLFQLHQGGKDGQSDSRNETGSGQDRPLAPLDLVDHGSGPGPDVRKEEVRSPQLEEGHPDVPPPGGIA